MNSDFFLVRQAKKGDPQAVDILVRKYYDTILNYCIYHLKDRHTAEDLAQETFLTFFKTLPNYKHEGKLLNYLYTLARNKCNDEKKRKRNTEVALDAVMDTAEAETSCGLEAKEDANAIAEAVERLPEEIKDVILLYYFEEKKVKEIAQICGISLPNCKYRLRRGREQIRGFLEESGWRG